MTHSKFVTHDATVWCVDWLSQLAVHAVDAAKSVVWTAAVELNSVHHAAGVAVVFSKYV